MHFEFYEISIGEFVMTDCCISVRDVKMFYFTLTWLKRPTSSRALIHRCYKSSLQEKLPLASNDPNFAILNDIAPPSSRCLNEFKTNTLVLDYFSWKHFTTNIANISPFFSLYRFLIYSSIPLSPFVSLSSFSVRNLPLLKIFSN